MSKTLEQIIAEMTEDEQRQVEARTSEILSMTEEMMRDMQDVGIKAPNDETRAAMEEARAISRARRARFASAEELIDDIKGKADGNPSQS